MVERDYKEKDPLEEPVDYTRRKKKKSAKVLSWDEYYLVDFIADLINWTMTDDEAALLSTRLQDFIGHPEKYDRFWNSEIRAMLRGMERTKELQDQKITVASSLEKKIRENLRFRGR